MPFDSAFIIALALKMLATAAVVVTASLIAERAGALIGAMVATLPIASGPAYILLALDHSAQFIADSTVTSLAVHAATGAFGTAYVLAAQRGAFAAAIAAAVGIWLVCALMIRAADWSLAAAMVFVPRPTPSACRWCAGISKSGCRGCRGAGSMSPCGPRWWRRWSVPS